MMGLVHLTGSKLSLLLSNEPHSQVYKHTNYWFMLRFYALVFTWQEEC